MAIEKHQHIVHWNILNGAYTQIDMPYIVGYLLLETVNGIKYKAFCIAICFSSYKHTVCRYSHSQMLACSMIAIFHTIIRDCRNAISIIRSKLYIFYGSVS